MKIVVCSMVEPCLYLCWRFLHAPFLQTVRFRAAGDLAGNSFFPVSVKCLPSQVCFNFLSELANGRSKIENSTISKWVCTRVCTRRRSSRSSSVNSRIQRWANVLLHCTAWRSTMDEKFRFQSDTYIGTLLRRVNGSSGFCKGPRTSKVWKSKDPKGPRTFRLCKSADLCKNYYSH